MLPFLYKRNSPSPSSVLPMAAIFTGSPLAFPTSSAASGGSRRPSPVGFVTIPSPPSLYELLRVKETASPGEIKTAYRSLAKQLHPDVAGEIKTASPGEIKTAYRSLAKQLHRDVAGERSDDGPDFVIVHRAYKTLSDPAARAKYDLSVGPISLAFAGDLRDAATEVGDGSVLVGAVDVLAQEVMTVHI